MEGSVLSKYRSTVDQIDWSRESLDADEITSEMMGSCRHFKEENRPGPFVGLSCLDMEIKILRDAGWRDWAGECEWTGKPLWRHMLTMIKLLLPKTDIHPHLADAVQLFCLSIGSGHKLLHMLGSQNSAKSGSTVRIAFAVMAVYPRESAVYFANPFDSASDSTIWGEVEECYDEILQSSPGLFSSSVKYALRKIDLVPGLPKAGTMEIRNVKHVGKFKGTKTRKTGEVDGPIIVGIDEVNEIYVFAFMRILSNMVSQDGFFAVTSQNFKDTGDMGGQLATPVAVASGDPGSYKELDREVNHVWNSFGKSMTIRFCGMRSPNILAGREIYPYLFKKENLDYMRENYGGNSPEFYSQVYSFPLEGDDSNSVLSQARINASRHDDPFFTIVRVVNKVAFCDPSFGGGDKAMWGVMEIADVEYLDPQGDRHESRILIPGTMMSIRLEKGMAVGEDMVERARGLGIDSGIFVSGKTLSVEDQIALQCLEWNRNEGIKSGNFGYDFSMRPDIVMSMSRIIGTDTVPFDYNTEPHGYQIHCLNGNSKDVCRNRIDELAFLVSDVFANQRLRGGSSIMPAILQLSRTRFTLRHNRRIVEKKPEFKARWRGSPDERDVLMGNVGMAYRGGFAVQSISGQERSERQEAMRRIMARKGVSPSSSKPQPFKARKGKRLKSRVETR